MSASPKVKVSSEPVSFIDLTIQHQALRQELLNAVQSVFDSQQFILKKQVQLLEERIASEVGSKYALGVASGSDALFLALNALGIGPGDEVLTTPFTFFATAGAVSRTGAKPIFADIDERTYNINPNEIATKVTPKTKAIVVVHLFGLSADMRPLLEFASKKGIYVIEDAAQAYGAKYDGQYVGGLGHFGCFSFYPTKNLGGAGDGGLMTTSSPVWADYLKRMRDHGSRVKYHHEIIGVNSRLDEIQAAVLLVKMKHIHQWNQTRRKLAQRYNDGLKGLPVNTPVTPHGYEHVYHLYSITADRRNELSIHLTKNNIGNGIYYPLPLHLQPCYKDLGYKKGDFPFSERAAERILSLPIYPELDENSVDRVIASVKEFYGSC